MKTKKIRFSIILFLLIGAYSYAQNVGIGSESFTPDPSAMLEVKATDKGFLPPRMTNSERDNILNPADGLFIFNTTTGCLNYRLNNSWHVLCGSTVSSLDCEGVVLTGLPSGTLSAGVAASGVNSIISYTGGNGGSHIGQTVNSTSVTGLTATLQPGSFANGNGTLTYSITGTPDNGGNANFAINIGGQSCTIEIPVAEQFPCGTSVTFNYKGETVTYGTVLSSNNRCWFDRNLGATAVCNSSTHSACYGDLFQWGRGDDGHQNRTSSAVWGTSNSDQPGHGNFIRNSNHPGDWRTDNNNGRWNAIPIINNPCPESWRLPTIAELDSERTNWNSNNANGAFSSPLKLPLAGNRSFIDGALGGVNTYGYYWTSSVSSSNSGVLFFYNTDADVSYTLRAEAYSVRCIKD